MATWLRTNQITSMPGKMVSTPAAASTPQSMPDADTVRVITAAIGLAFTEVRVRASSSSTQENMKQKNAVTPMPEPISGMKIFIPLIGSGIGVTAFFCFMFSWVELLLARTLTSVNAKPIAAVITRTVSASGIDWGVLAAAGVLTILPGMLVIWFVRNHVAKGFALGRV